MELTFIKKLNEWLTDASHWELPFKVQAKRGLTKWVIVAKAADQAVLVFPADKFGDVLEWTELYSDQDANRDPEAVLLDFIAKQENKETE